MKDEKADMKSGIRDRKELKWKCPKCGAEIREPVLWGCGWGRDEAVCTKCGYDGGLKTMTGIDPDGTYWQMEMEEEGTAEPEGQAPAQTESGKPDQSDRAGRR